jgi:ribulose-phosphate 3-epimerase
MTVLIAPSILSADFGALREQVGLVERGGADLIHIDVMDGHFVPNITMGPVVVEAIRRATTLPLDVHLMIAEPDRYLKAFADAGASRVAVHIEAVAHVHRTVQLARSLGLSPGVAVNPGTPAAALEAIAPDLDHVLVMSVNPGFSGQTFIPQSESKIRAVRALLDRTGSQAVIGVDGGVDAGNAGRLAAAGAQVLVAASAIFKTADPARATRALRAAAGGEAVAL